MHFKSNRLTYNQHDNTAQGIKTMASQPKTVAEIKAEMAALAKQLEEQTSTRVSDIQAKLAELADDTGKSMLELLGFTKPELKAEAERFAKVSGQTVAELFGIEVKPQRKPRTTTPKTGEAKQPQPPKYANPKNKSDTWSGRGRTPAWYNDFTKAGGAVADIELSDEEVVAWKKSVNYVETAK